MRITHKPGDSSSLIFLFLSTSFTVLSFQSAIIACLHSLITTWLSSWGSLPSPSILFGLPYLFNVPFQLVPVGRTKISGWCRYDNGCWECWRWWEGRCCPRSLSGPESESDLYSSPSKSASESILDVYAKCLGTFLVPNLVASSSFGGTNFAINRLSICLKGNNLMLMASKCGGGPTLSSAYSSSSRWLTPGSRGSGGGRSSYRRMSCMASMMIRMERTRLSWMTERQRTRSSRKAVGV